MNYTEKLLDSFIIVCTVLLFSIGQTAIAEEIVAGHPVRWSIKSSNGLFYQTNISVDQLPSNHVMRSILPTAAANWNNINTKALCTRTSFNTSNVDLSVGSSTFFEEAYNPLALTILTDTNGKVLTKNSDYGTTNGKIKYANIQFRPSLPSDVTSTSTYGRGLLVHEIGHVYGLGHTAQTVSVMNPNRYIYYAVPQSYDVTIVNSFYK